MDRSGLPRARPFRDAFPGQFDPWQQRSAASIELKRPRDIVEAIQTRGLRGDGRVAGILRKATEAGELQVAFPTTWHVSQQKTLRADMANCRIAPSHRGQVFFLKMLVRAP